MKNTSSSKFGRRVSLLVAVLVMVVLVGSLVVVLNFTHRPGTDVTGAGATATPTTQPTATANPNRPAHEGQIVYSSPQSNGDYSAFAWSPDSQRVAAGTNGQVQIWDATTGGHPVTFTPTEQNNLLLALSWSPDGRYVAVPSASATAVSGRVQIIDATAGTVIRTFTSSIDNSGAAGAYSIPSSGGQGVPLLEQIPLGSIGGIDATAWSPDGNLVLTTFGRNDVVWNPSTGAVVYRFRDGAPTKSVSWSPDSKYITSANANGAVQVWNAHTGQVIFQQQTNGQGYAAWAPNGMVIAFSTNNGSGKDGNPFVEVWNVTTKTQIASYTGSVDGPLVWSPDGKEIASSSGGDNIVVWDATTGTPLYTFTQQGGFVLSLAWSPDGKYIVSGSSSVSSSTGGGSYARVWVA